MKINLTATLHMWITLLSVVIGCNKEPDPVPTENTILKTKLDGTWFRELSGGLVYDYFEVRFAEDSMYYYDSIVFAYGEYGNIQSERGSLKVLYTFNDNIEHFNPKGTQGVYSFKNFKENDILWVLENDNKQSTFRNYEVRDYVVSLHDQFKGPAYNIPIRSSAVTISTDTKNVKFCEPRDVEWCYEFARK